MNNPVASDSDAIFENVSCALCGADKFEPICEKGGETTGRCGDCGLVYVNPRKNFENIKEVYEDDYSIDYQVKSRKKLIRTRRWVKRVRRAGYRSGRWLDIGCSACFVLKLASDYGFDAWGIDFDQSGLDFGRKEFGLTNLFVGPLQQQKFETGSFTVISMYDVIEHVPDINDFLDELHRILADDGILDIRTPDVGHWRVPKDLCSWGGVVPGEHLYNFSHKTMAAMLKKHGFEVVYRQWNLKQALVVHARKIKSS